ncbi:alpha-1,2-fucosyltransferase [Roseivirga sp.]|uniref:alpha-1,2-fucosyltransferase n=1 Tax=Roseivirga sp. TaxID=1964215 RepID=UPI003B8D60B8
MIQVRLKGGLGNQMFQYAFGLGQAQRLGTSLKLDCSALLDRARGKDFVYRNMDLDVFKAQPEFSMSPNLLHKYYMLKSSTLSRWLKNYAARGLTIEKERHFHVDKNLIKNPVDNALYDGWWQSEKYFSNVADIVKKAFCFRNAIISEAEELFKQIEGSQSVCLNVRRTDFLTTPALNATNLDYFLRSADIMSDLIEKPHFFVFSDDIKWCKENIKLEYPVTIVGHEMKGYKFDNYLHLMKTCKNFIIPNSSFAWWAVWLNENKERNVIAPKKWFNEGDFDTSDLVSKSWLKM